MSDLGKFGIQREKKMKQALSKITAVFATGTAFFGSCCALPLLLMSLGVGGMGFAAALVPYQPYFMAGTGLLLAVSFYLVYGRKKICDGGGTCDVKNIRRTKIMLWIATGLALLFLVGPTIIQCIL